jgi:hypothetical protein
MSDRRHSLRLAWMRPSSCSTITTASSAVSSSKITSPTLRPKVTLVNEPRAKPLLPKGTTQDWEEIPKEAPAQDWEEIHSLYQLIHARSPAAARVSREAVKYFLIDVLLGKLSVCLLLLGGCP